MSLVNLMLISKIWIIEENSEVKKQKKKIKQKKRNLLNVVACVG